MTITSIRVVVFVLNMTRRPSEGIESPQERGGAAAWAGASRSSSARREAKWAGGRETLPFRKPPFTISFSRPWCRSVPWVGEEEEGEEDEEGEEKEDES